MFLQHPKSERKNIKFKKLLSFALVGLILNLALYSTAKADVSLVKVAKFAEQVKANIAQLGTGKDAKIEIKLKDGTKLKGYVSAAKDTSFILVTEDTGMSKEIPYPQVQKAKGKNSKTGLRILAVVAVVGLLVLLSYGAARGN